MAVYKNYYNRRVKLSITVSCLYLLCSTINCIAMGGERVRHHHGDNSNNNNNKQEQQQLFEEDVYVSQLEKSAIEDSSKTPPVVSCPNCLYKANGDVKLETDSLRLEAIKRQILSKLGLRHKPNVTHQLPREVIMETLFRAEDSDDFFKNAVVDGADDDGQDPSTTSARTSAFETVDVDDFYGRTSEIISFAEQGYMVNGNRLLEFRVSAEPGQSGQEFTVRTATLWLKADVRRARTSKCKSTDIYVFKFISNLSHSVRVNSQEFNNLAKEPVVVPLEDSNPGWQKIDLTEIVRTWLTPPPRSSSSIGGGGGNEKKKKLRLLVDCSCCDNWRIHLFNNNNNNNKADAAGGSAGTTDGSSSRSVDPDRPFLVIHTDPSTAKRVRRRALDCSVDSGNQCCKQRFYVSFKQLGWDDWVIAPQGYYANYCRGDCGHHRTPDMYVTYHTHVIEEVRKTHHLSGMQPCCAPLKFSSMSLIYFGPDSNIIKRDLPKMVVDECGCP